MVVEPDVDAFAVAVEDGKLARFVDGNGFVAVDVPADNEVVNGKLPGGGSETSGSVSSCLSKRKQFNLCRSLHTAGVYQYRAV